MNLNDITIKATYTKGNNVYTGTATVTITPVISNFTVTPGGGQAGRNISFRDNVNATSGMWAKTADGGAGALFQANLTIGNPTQGGTPQYIHNALDLQNSVNGTKDANGVAVGATFKQNSAQPSQNAVAINGTSFAMLDTLGDPHTPEYTTDTLIGITPPVATIVADDYPGPGPTLTADDGTKIDILFKFRLHLVWRYWPSTGKIFYPLAFINWQAMFYASGAGPVNMILELRGVTADGNYTPSNAEPAVMVPPVVSGNTGWVNVG
jgi:hypothetical protein